MEARRLRRVVLTKPLASAPEGSGCACGCDAEAAALIAVHPEVSVTEAAHLLERGCEPRTALRILL